VPEGGDRAHHPGLFVLVDGVELAIAFWWAFFPMWSDTATRAALHARSPARLRVAVAASPLSGFAKCSFPSALPFIFSGRQGAFTLAVSGRDRLVRLARSRSGHLRLTAIRI